jgi:hypothetical protein
MNKVVRREHVPASEIPENLRGEIPATATVTVTVVEEQSPRSAKLESLLARRKPPFLSAEEISERIRSERDGWDG